MAPNEPLTALNCGITTDHIGKIKDVATANKCFIFARLVNRDSTQLIDEGYATKALDIHAKSSDWGPMAGFICTDSTLSKVVGDQAKEDHNTHAVEEAKRRRGVVGVVQLAISPERAVSLLGHANAGQATLVTHPKKPAVKREFRLGALNAAGRHPVEYKNNGVWVPVDVLGYVDRVTGIVEAVTADYDIFAICPHFSAPGFTVSSGTRAMDQGMDGVLTAFQQSMKGKINEACRPGSTKNVVNHGTELNNPFPENEPEVAMFPPGAAGVARLVPRMKLHLIFGDLTIRGFHVYVNQLWGAAFKTHIGAKMSRVRNPALRGALKLEYLTATDFDGLTIAAFAGPGQALSAAQQRFGTEVGNNATSSLRPRWR